MSKCGQVVQEGGVTVCEHTCIWIYIYMYIYIYTYIHWTYIHTYKTSTPYNPAPLQKKYVKYMSIADMKQTAYQKHFKVCLTNNLKVFLLDRKALQRILPLDGRFKIEDYTENFPEKGQSWPKPKQHSSSLQSALPLD